MDRNNSKNWSLLQLFRCLRTPEDTFNWLSSEGLLPAERYCERHKKNMTYEKDHALGLFICKFEGKRHLIARSYKTWFENWCYHPPEVCVVITYCFANNFSLHMTLHESNIIQNGPTVTLETIEERFALAREICMLALARDSDKQQKIGGPGSIIELFEAPIGKRVNELQRSQALHGWWVLGMLQKGTTNYRYEFYSNTSKDEKGFINVIKKNIKRGSQLSPNCGRTLINLNKFKEFYEGCSSFSVNEYKDVEEDMQFDVYDSERENERRNASSSSWFKLKYKFSQANAKKEDLDLYLCEFLWRKRVKRLNLDPFDTLKNDIKYAYST